MKPELDAATSSRAQAQQARILCAAKSCFIEHGFHAASMATIADTAGMSAGLIYRYFDNKNAIILAIIEQQLSEKRADIASMKSAGDLRARIGELFSLWRSGDGRAMSPALFLEMSALAKRDPTIAEAVLAADATTREYFMQWMRSRAEAPVTPSTDADILARSLALQCLIEGLAVRAVREPNMADETVAAALSLMLPILLPTEH